MSAREYPKVWSRFERIVEDRRTLKFEIEDIPASMWSTAVEFMLGNYIREDEYRVLLSSIIRQKMSIACFLAEGDGTGRTLVAVNMCLPQEKGRFVGHSPPKTKAGLLSLRMFAEAMKVTAIYDKYDVNAYLMGTGLSVAPEYRRLGIAIELLSARKNLSKELGFRATGGIFTGAKAQISAEKAGMECLYQIPYKKFGKQCNIKFHTDTVELKIFGAKLE
ncbi:Retinol-binding protein [Operophtera brumata]|uniref:Retinol-binding protein n=1 Tax=Operophtera brumata TaxID=104452 RepID=A0A0L7KMJ3_OPEBR|nr:Retinol-binding protein [Operophtera brumata]